MKTIAAAEARRIERVAKQRSIAAEQARAKSWSIADGGESMLVGLRLGPDVVGWGPLAGCEFTHRPGG